jgi:multimeric flavodoxin WrbA
MKIAPCQNCGGCDRTGVCVIDDGMGAVYEALRGADRVVMASPIFFMGITAQMKALIDRCQAFWCEKYLLGREIPAGEHGRKGLVLLVGGMKRDAGIECAKTCATAFLRTISVPEHTTLAYKGVDVKGDIAKHPSALSEAFEAGRALVA